MRNNGGCLNFNFISLPSCTTIENWVSQLLSVALNISENVAVYAVPISSNIFVNSKLPESWHFPMLLHAIPLVRLMQMFNIVLIGYDTDKAAPVNLFTLELHFKRCNSYGEAPCSMEIMIVLYHFTNIPFSHPACLSLFLFNMHSALSFGL